MANPFDQFDSPQQGPVYGPPPKAPAPRDPYAVQLDQLQIQQKQNELQNAPLEQEIKRFDLEEKKRQALQGPKLDEADQKAAAKRAALTSLETQINRVDELYRKGFKDEALGFISSLSEYLPSDEASALNTAGAGLAEQGLAAFRVPGVGSQSDTELRQFVEANRPSSWDRDVAVEEKLQQLRGRVDATRAEMGLPPAQWGGAPQPAAEAPQDPSTAVYDANLGGQELAASTNGFQTVDNPELSGVRGEYLQRLGAGQSAGEIIPWLRQAGVTDPKIMRSVLQQVQFRKANPNVPIEKYNTDVLDDMDVPLSAMEGAMNDLGRTAPGAYLMRAGNAVSMNALDDVAGAMGGNAERVRIGLDDASRNNPVASFAGDLSGGIMAAMGAEGALAARGVTAGLGRAVTADMAYGAGAGAGAAEGDRLSGAVAGGLAGLAGSLGGQAVARGAASAISPTGGRLADLYEQGVRPTPGQRLGAADGRVSGLIGRIANTTEEGIGSIPVVGAGVRGARQDARDQFQLGAYNQALGDLGLKLPNGMKPGTAPYKFTKKAFDNAYDKAREGMRVAADEELANEIGELGNQAGMLAEPSIKRFESIVRNTLLRRVGETIEGAEFKKIQSELGGVIRGIRGGKTGDDELATVLEGLQGALDRAARRHSDPAAVELLDRTDAGYAKFVRIRGAAKSRGGAAAEFTPNQFDRSVQSNTGGRHSDAYLRGDALMQEYAQQGMALADRLPNSGTADRIMVGAGATGAAGAAGFMEPSTLGVLGVLGALYAPGVRKAVAGSMSPRGPKARAVADKVRKRARLSGAAGAAALTNQTSGGQ